MIFLLGEEAIPKRAGYTGSRPTTGAIHANTTITAVYTKDSGIVIPTQPTSLGESMSGGEGEPGEADVPAEDETVAPQGMHVTGTQTVTHEYLTLNGKVARETISLWFYSLAFRFSSFLLDLDRSIHQNTGSKSCALVVAFNSISSPKCVKGNQQAFGC